VYERNRRDIDEIEFDFFDDAPVAETTERPAPPKRRRRLPTRPPTGPGSAPLLRFAALIVGGIALAVILVFVVNRCREEQKRAEYEDYMEAVARVSSQSEQVGRNLNKLIFSAGINLEDLRSELDGLRRQQSQAVANAEELEPPGPLRDQQESLVQALQLRVSGLNGLSHAFAEISATAKAGEAGKLLAEQSDRLVASDVVYDDFFKAPAQDALRRNDITDVAVPDSDFVTNRDLTSARSWRLIIRRLNQRPAAGGLHGNQLAGVRVLPGGTRLSPTEENTVEASARLAFEVLVTNSGDNQETQVKVNLTIQQSPDSIRKEQVIESINPGETQPVVFRNLGQVQYGQRLILKVTVEPVAGEKITNNNTAEYVLIFTLPG
jgi:hypothetical protein